MTRSHAYRGAGLEATLDLAHDLYNKRDVARIRHYHLAGEYRAAGRGGPAGFRPLPKADQPPDYHGCVASRMVVFDAKQTDGRDGWTLDSRYAHQYDRLRWWSEAAALAFFAVECLPREQLSLLRIKPTSPWPMVTFGPGWSIEGSFARFTDPDCLVVDRTDEGWYDWIAACRAAGWLDPA